MNNKDSVLFCENCGGMVGEDGLAPLGEQEEFSPHEGEMTDQQKSTIQMRDSSGFAAALSKKGYASEPSKSAEKPADGDSEMKRKRAEHYGRFR